MKSKKTIELLSNKFANAMLNNFQLNKIRGGDDDSHRNHEVPPVVVPPNPGPPPRR